jgi:uncharacterized protein YutE (UPF0331/DUF86 family)
LKKPDVERIERRLEAMHASLDRVGEIRAAGAERLCGNVAAQAHLRRELQVALQACIDAGAEILLVRDGEVPETFTEAFDRLAEEGVLPQEMSRRLHGAAELRNRLIFQYLDEPDPAALLDELDVLEDLERFSATVREFLGREAD